MPPGDPTLPRNLPRVDPGRYRRHRHTHARPAQIDDRACLRGRKERHRAVENEPFERRGVSELHHVFRHVLRLLETLGSLTFGSFKGKLYYLLAHFPPHDLDERDSFYGEALQGSIEVDELVVGPHFPYKHAVSTGDQATIWASGRAPSFCRDVGFIRI